MTRKTLLKKQILGFDPGSTEPERLWVGPGDLFCLINLQAFLTYSKDSGLLGMSPTPV